ncbi:MAG TPA: hypothetical protein VG456_18160 [Candidatus Sulfopaludibacter sp.]|jgi:hypothetical protein|nr:hypothetical protein [Candidatus Sulfopaludibacter sp.]
MSSVRQIEANRRNAQKSTGPATNQGKAAIRFNALKSGIDAESMIIPGEDIEKLKTLAAEFADTWKPADAQERELLDQLTDDAWRLRRLRAIEAKLWADPDAFTANSVPLARLHRMINAIKRSQHQTIKDLHFLQSTRQKAAAEAQTELEEQSQFEAQTEPEEQSQFAPVFLSVSAPRRLESL